jgi:hypothetical protein
MISARVRWACLLLVLVAGAPRSSQADDAASESESHVRRGVELRQLNRDAEALVEFQRAFDLAPTPRARAQVALALQALGDWVGAEIGLEDALRVDADPWIIQYRHALEGALATVQAHLAWLWVDANVSSGELLLNGVPVHSIPLDKPARVVVGTLDIEVRAANHLPAHRRLEVFSEANLRESLALESLPSSAEPHSAASGAVSLSEPGPPSGGRASVRALRTGGYVAFGAAAAFAGGGLAAWRVHEDQVAIYNDDGRCRVGLATRDQQCGGAGRAADIALGLEIGAFAVSAISAGAGVWLLWRSDPRSSQVATWCTPSGVVGVACGGAF